MTAMIITTPTTVLATTIKTKKQKTADDDGDLLRFYDTTVERLKSEAGNNDHAPISGNLYSYLSLREFGDSSGLFQKNADFLMLVGLYLIILVQLVGPCCVLFWAYHKVDCFPNHTYVDLTQSWGYVGGSNEHGVSAITTRILGVCFVGLFCMNGAYVMKSDANMMRKTLDMNEVFRVVAQRNVDYPEPNNYWLWLGVIVNSFCLLSCSFCMVLLFVIAEDGPKDVLFDGLALTFLYNLDDVSGDLGFLDEKWDEDQFGDIYGGLADQTSSSDRQNLIDSIREDRDAQFTPDNFLVASQYIMIVFSIVFPLIYAFGNIQKKAEVEEVAGVDPLAALQSNLTAMQATLQVVQAQLNAQLVQGR